MIISATQRIHKRFHQGQHKYAVEINNHHQQSISYLVAANYLVSE